MIGKVVLITGAGSGIGRRTAIAFAQAGASVGLLGRRAEALEETRNLTGHTDRCLVLPCDVTDPTQVEAAFAVAAVQFGRIDVLFNNAGAFDGTTPIEDVMPDQWQRVIDVNLSGAFFSAQAAYRIMLAQSPKGGRIINNGSISAQVPRPQAISYSASKAAITGLTRGIALEGRAHGIACAQLDIGNASTTMTEGMATGMMQADGEIRPEPTMDVANAVQAVLFVAALPLEANIPNLTIVASAMPFGGRG